MGITGQILGCRKQRWDCISGIAWSFVLAPSQLGFVTIATALREVLQLSVVVVGVLTRAEYERSRKKILLARWLCAS